MIRIVCLVALLSTAVAPSAARAQSLLSSVEIGMSEKSLSKTLSQRGVSFERWRATDPRGLTRGLVDTGLLAMWNRFDETPKDESGQLRSGAFSTFFVTKDAARRHVFVVSDKTGVTAVLMSVDVPVDTSADRGGVLPSAPERLMPLKSELRALSQAKLAPALEDGYHNSFAWRGALSGGRVAVLYVPEDDRLLVMLHR